MKKLPEHVSEDDIKEMFSVADTNGDGVLDIEEFGRMVIPSPIRSAKNRLRMKKQNFDIEELRRYMTLRMGQNFKWFSKSEGDPKGKVSFVGGVAIADTDAKVFSQSKWLVEFLGLHLF